MRIAILMIMLSLTACGGSNNTVIPDNDPPDNDSAFATQTQVTQQISQAVSTVPNESTSFAALRAEVVSLSDQLKQLQLIGRPVGQP